MNSLLTLNNSRQHTSDTGRNGAHCTVGDYEMDFDLMLLEPATKGEVAATGGDTTRDEVLALIETQLALFVYPKVNDQPLYEIGGDTVTFTLRYGGRALTLLPD